MAPSPRLVHLLSVAKAFSRSGGATQPVLRPTSMSLPTDRRVAILGGKRTGKTSLLRLLAGKLAPDEGRLVTQVRLSPVANNGALFHPQLTVLENVQFVARMYRLDAKLLALGIAGLRDNAIDLDAPLKSYDSGARRALEAAAIIILPFDCYLIDDAGQLPPDLVARIFEAAASRNSGVIFATSNARFVRQHAEALIVVEDATLHPFAEIEEGIEFFDRRSG